MVTAVSPAMPVRHLLTPLVTCSAQLVRREPSVGQIKLCDGTLDPTPLTTKQGAYGRVTILSGEHKLVSAEAQRIRREIEAADWLCNDVRTSWTGAGRQIDIRA